MQDPHPDPTLPSLLSLLVPSEQQHLPFPAESRFSAVNLYFSLFGLKNNKHSKSGCNVDINGSFTDVLWVTPEITCIYWVQRMPQTTAPRPEGGGLCDTPLRTESLCEGKLLWNKKAKQLHELCSKFLFQELFLPSRQSLAVFIFFLLVYFNLT